MSGPAAELYLNEAAARALLLDLHAAGVLAMDNENPPGVSYAPSCEGLRRKVDRLAESYPQHLVEISNLIHARNRTRGLVTADTANGRERS